MPATVVSRSASSCFFEVNGPFGYRNVLQGESILGNILFFGAVGGGSYLYVKANEMGGYPAARRDVIASGEKMQEKKPTEPAVMPSGRYVGATEEDDGTQQLAFSRLEFRLDGRVTGSGYDSEDGKFNIVDGYWSDTQAVWI